MGFVLVTGEIGVGVLAGFPTDVRVSVAVVDGALSLANE